MMKILTYIIFIFLLSPSAYCLCTIKQNNRVRISPDINGKVVIQLKKYTPMNLIRSEGNWHYVRGKNFDGWIHKTIVTDSFHCMLVLDPKNIKCPSLGASPPGRITYLESFKILKQEIGCNYVENAQGKKFWINSSNIWPKDEGLFLQISK